MISFVEMVGRLENKHGKKELIITTIVLQILVVPESPQKKNQQ